MRLFIARPDGAYQAHNSTVIGDVKVGAKSSFWFSSVVRGDVAPIVVGKRVNVQDCAVIHCDADIPNFIEDDVVIGHGATIHGAFIGRGSLIGMGATLLGHCKIGAGCLVAAGAVVPPGLVAPDGHMVMGVPGKVARPVKPEELEYMQWLVPHYVELAEKYVRGDFDPK
jgi:carbonic anhydrase/acetyltransferase-like protein (isoleucine patch superfamily)